jgi:hypothetical protein
MKWLLFGIKVVGSSSSSRHNVACACGFSHCVVLYKCMGVVIK